MKGMTFTDSSSAINGKAKIPPIEASVVANPAMLPPTVDCLLGLPFLESLQSLVTLDLRSKQLRFSEGTMQQQQQSRLYVFCYTIVLPSFLVCVLLHACIT